MQSCRRPGGGMNPPWVDRYLLHMQACIPPRDIGLGEWQPGTLPRLSGSLCSMPRRGDSPQDPVAQATHQAPETNARATGVGCGEADGRSLSRQPWETGAAARSGSRSDSEGQPGGRCGCKRRARIAESDQNTARAHRLSVPQLLSSPSARFHDPAARVQARSKGGRGRRRSGSVMGT